MNIVVLVIASRGPAYDRFLENWRAQILPANVCVKYLFCSEDQATAFEVRGDSIFLKGRECVKPALHYKTLAAMSQSLLEPFDYVLRTNLSSYINFRKLNEFLEDKPREFCAAGTYFEGSFLSGSGYILTRDLVEKFLEWCENSCEMNPMCHHDDEIMGTFVKEVRPNFYQMNGITYQSTMSLEDAAEKLHVRFKTSWIEEKRGADIEQHREAIEKYNNDIYLLSIPKGCSNNENTIWRRGGRLVKEGPHSSMEGEIYFYKTIQGTSIQGLFPAYFGESYVIDRSFLTLEFLNGVSVSSIFRKGLMTKSILGAVVDIIQQIHQTHIEFDNIVTKDDIMMNYLGKLNERIQCHPNYMLNSIGEVLKIINHHITIYVNSPGFVITDVIHGDPWFDNMIYNYKDHSVKLLDMKGKVGKIFSLKGDKMVDYAKLYQSILGFDYALYGDKYPSEYEANCREWLSERLLFSLEDPIFEAITACCILKTFFYFSKTEPIESIYRSLKKLRLFYDIL